MPDISFPSNPSVNDTYSFGGKTWIWTGSYWALNTAGSINGINIGNITPATGAFTTLSSSGNTTLGNIAGNVLPAANVTYDLGSTSQRWNDIWLANSTIYLGEANISASGTAVVLPANTTVGGIVISPVIIANTQITDSSWTVKDDTAISTEGGYFIINGSGFQTGAQVIIGSTPAASVSVVSSSVIRVQSSAASAGTYVIYVTNPDGGVAILVNGLTFSGTPTWITGSTLANVLANSSISVQLNATGANIYTVSAGNVLPTGTSLSSGGLLTGNISVANVTTYSFSVDAIDTELQESPRTFSLTVTVTVPDPYFYLTTLLLPGTGSNGAQNNTFVDSSTNNFAVTRNGNTTQGTFSPFSQTGWSNYFDGSGDDLTTPSNAAFTYGTSDFCVEGWFYFTGGVGGSGYSYAFAQGASTGTSSLGLYIQGGVYKVWNGSAVITGTASFAQNTWVHLAVTRSGTTMRLFVNGTQDGSATNSNNITTGTTTGISIGRWSEISDTNYITGYVSNFRVVKGSAVYTSAFTPSTTPLTAITNTSLLTCQSNRFVDNSSNAFAITVNGNTSVQAFSPFAPTAAWSASTNGGSGYFDENGDYLDCGNGGTDYEFGSGDFTIEGWFYCLGKSQRHQMIMAKGSPTTSNAYDWRLYWGDTSNQRIWFDSNVFSVSSDATTAEDLVLNAWNHIAVVRSGANGYLYLNGTRIDSVAAAGTMNNSYTNVYVGAGNVGSAGQTYYNGYANGIRLLKGTAQYTGSTYTVPTSPFTAITNTELLLNFTNAGIYDATARNDLETIGGAQISTAQSKFGGSSMYFDGTGDEVKGLNTTVSIISGTQNFTIEGWIYPTAAGSDYKCVYTNGFPIQIYYKSNTIEAFCSDNGSTGSYFVNPASGPASAATINAWSHFAFVRNGSSFRVYVNGIGGTVVTASNSVAVPSASQFEIGAALQFGGYEFTGYINDLRVTRGIARYTTNFTPPTTAFATE